MCARRGLRGPRQGEAAGGGGGGSGLQGRLSGGEKVLPQQDTPRGLVMTMCDDLSEAAPFLLLLQNYAMRLKKPITETQKIDFFVTSRRRAEPP